MNAVLLDKITITSENYRSPMPVAHFRKYQATVYYVCPRCNVTMEREFMAYCDRCGQCLSWMNYKKMIMIK